MVIFDISDHFGCLVSLLLFRLVKDLKQYLNNQYVMRNNGHMRVLENNLTQFDIFLLIMYQVYTCSNIIIFSTLIIPWLQQMRMLIDQQKPVMLKNNEIK